MSKSGVSIALKKKIGTSLLGNMPKRATTTKETGNIYWL